LVRLSPPRSKSSSPIRLVGHGMCKSSCSIDSTDLTTSSSRSRSRSRSEGNGSSRRSRSRSCGGVVRRSTGGNGSSSAGSRGHPNRPDISPSFYYSSAPHRGRWVGGGEYNFARGGVECQKIPLPLNHHPTSSSSHCTQGIESTQTQEERKAHCQVEDCSTRRDHFDSKESERPAWPGDENIYKDQEEKTQASSTESIDVVEKRRDHDKEERRSPDSIRLQRIQKIQE
jgi:hypothetical protein